VWPIRLSELQVPASCAATKLQTVKRRVAVHQHGHTVHRLRKVKRRVATSLVMPSEFIAQNGAAIHQSTKVAVTGCEKHKSRRGGRVGHGRKKGGRGGR
jgi:hypothetical protein